MMQCSQAVEVFCSSCIEHYSSIKQWNFRIGFTPREGLVIHSVAYVDDSRGRRPVAHRLSFVEMVVPYGDPNEPHYRKNAFDAGEDGLGKNAHSLKKVNYYPPPFCF